MTDRRLTSDQRRSVVRWIAQDPSPADAAELQAVLAAGLGADPAAVADLENRLIPLAFGTAGLRGPLRAGPGGMNLATVRRTAAGLAAYLKGRPGATDGVGTVVVGYDARRRSAEFARDVAGVLGAAGFRALLAPRALPTPVTAYAVRALDAVAGVQITASHNPPQDNGIKVYLDGGGQLVPPDDGRIEAAIAAAPPARSVDSSGPIAEWPADLLDDYLESCARVGGAAPGAAPLRIVSTALHGVGGEPLVRALRLAGFTDVAVVPEQAVPDGSFPTVAFPNPEEAGATDLLLALAQWLDADLAIANDPDADRVAIGVRFPDGWRMLSGDETGCLLGDFALQRLDRAAHPDPLVATTIVSSTLLADIAAAHGVRYAQTLTGFKWLVRAGDGAGTGLVYAYEEALGVCADPTVVRDKDGISAAVLAAKMTATLKKTGSSVPEALDALAGRFGLRINDAVSFRVDDLSQIATAMRGLRSQPPTDLLGDPVTTVTDLQPQTDAVILRTGAVRVVVRPSGTEPKLKCYLEIAVDAGDDIGRSRAAARQRLDALKGDLRVLLGFAG